MRILGVNFGHSPAAALLENGQILAAIEEEKLTRHKGEISFPNKAIAFVLKKGSLSVSDIDCVAVGCTDISEFGSGYRQLNRYFDQDKGLAHIEGLFFDGLKRCFPDMVDIRSRVTELFYKNMLKAGFPREKIILVNHHKAHAASAYYTCPWDQAAVVTLDGKGDGLCGSFYAGSQGRLECIDEIPQANSVGQFYQAVTKFLGFKVNRHEGKITGLAAFGNPAKSLPQMKELFSWHEGQFKNHFYDNGSFVKDSLAFYNARPLRSKDDFIHPNYLKSLHGPLMHFAVVYQLYIDYMKKKMSGVEAKDMAAGVQQLAEDATVAYIKRMLKRSPAKNICLAGGVFANVKINQRIREISGVENVYVQPAMNDSGTSLGAALVVWMERNPRSKWGEHKSVYLGPSYTDAQIEECLKKHNLSFQRVENVEKLLGKMIYEGKIIGRYDGMLEWGPRALGNRSIIARPIQKGINDSLNERLRRTEFMPFAPSMLDEDAPDFLVDYDPGHIASRYMTITYNVKPAMIDRIQAAVHVDGTARPQVVREKDNPSYYRIIKEYKKHSGFGVIVNTSFNMHEEPIVDTPEDAIRSFLVGAVDVLSLGPYIVEKSL